ncbi:hypothetical protein [Aliterella atlantica]|nr:hypothetical protein [Aliterella atlantica]
MANCSQDYSIDRLFFSITGIKYSKFSWAIFAGSEIAIALIEPAVW